MSAIPQVPEDKVEGLLSTKGDLLIAGILGGLIPLLLSCGGLWGIQYGVGLGLILVAVSGAVVGVRFSKRSSAPRGRLSMKIGALASLVFGTPHLLFWAPMAALTRSPKALGTVPEQMEMLGMLRVACDTMVLVSLMSLALVFALFVLGVQAGALLSHLGPPGSRRVGPTSFSLSRGSIGLRLGCVVLGTVSLFFIGYWALECAWNNAMDGFSQALEVDPQRGLGN
jgi:hypothetical protein